MKPLLDERVLAFREHGYFVVPGFLERMELDELRRVCDGALERVRAESSEKGHTSPSVNLLASAAGLGEGLSAFVRVMAFLSSPRVCALFDGLARAGEARAPRVKKADYYHEQTRHDWDGDWHRDSQFTEYDPVRERALVLTSTSVHVRVALEPDDRLEIVAGSHRRWDTEEELGIRKGALRSSSAMPGATRVALNAGDACVFHAWSIHRATYRCAPIRRTLDSLYAFGRETPERRWPSE